VKRRGDRKGVTVKRVRKDRGRGERATERRFLGQIAEWRHPSVAGLRAYYSSADELSLVLILCLMEASMMYCTVCLLISLIFGLG
jgi:hypothetical protein